jgi:hypothetical protein
MLRLTRATFLTALLAAPLKAQDAAAPDSTTQDSLSQAGPHNWRMLPAFAGLSLAFVVAPPALFLIPGLLTPDSTRTLPTHHVAAYLAGGGIGDGAPNSWTHSENIEVIQGHLFASASLEHLYTQQRLRFGTIRAGYLFRPNPGLAGGFTLGYRSVAGSRGEDAVLIGFPLAAGGEKVAVRVEPIYAVSRAGVSWTFKVQGDFHILPKPLFTGMLVEAKPLWQDGPYQGVVAVLFGIMR